MANSPIRGRYDRTVDRQSAYEMLLARAEQKAPENVERRHSPTGRSEQRAPRSASRQSFGEAMAKSVVRSIGSQLGRQIVRGILGSIFKGK